MGATGRKAERLQDFWVLFCILQGCVCLCDKNLTSAESIDEDVVHSVDVGRMFTERHFPHNGFGKVSLKTFFSFFI